MVKTLFIHVIYLIAAFLNSFCESGGFKNSPTDLEAILQQFAFETFPDILASVLKSSFESKILGLPGDKPSIFGPGFQTVPGGPNYLNRTVLSWHYYCWAIGKNCHYVLFVCVYGNRCIIILPLSREVTAT